MYIGIFIAHGLPIDKDPTHWNIWGKKIFIDELQHVLNPKWNINFGTVEAVVRNLVKKLYVSPEDTVLPHRVAIFDFLN